MRRVAKSVERYAESEQVGVVGFRGGGRMGGLELWKGAEAKVGIVVDGWVQGCAQELGWA